MKPVFLAVLLAACVPKPEIRYVGVECPPVPQCVRPQAEINTNADLARAYIETDAELEKCTIYRDTLQKCIDRYKQQNGLKK